MSKKENLKVMLAESVPDAQKELLRKFMATLPKGK